MWKSIITNWTTSLPALLIAICTTTELSGLLPETWFTYLMAICGFLTAIGLLAAKSSNVSNSPHPVEASVVSDSAASKPPAVPVQ